MPPSQDEGIFDMLERILTNTTQIGTDPLVQEWYKFVKIWLGLYSVYVPLTYIIIALGLVGNSVALLTLSLSKRMKTPTFDYHLTLVSADLLFCINFFLMKSIDYFMRSAQYATGHHNGYDSMWVAVYSGMVFSALNSISSYMAMYMILMIAVDRVIAMIVYSFYPFFNTHAISRCLVLISLGLSVIVNSWSIWFEKVIVKDANGYYEWNLRNGSTVALLNAIKVKDYYNGFIKIIYSILLSIFTAIIIAAFCRQQRFRKQALSAQAQGNGRSRRTNHESSLFILMISVAILAFLQVITRESRRFMKVQYPIGSLTCTFLNQSEPLDRRLHSFRIALYGFHLLKPIANLSTSMEKSFIFYLYFLLNRMFRNELLSIFCPRLCSSDNRLIKHSEDTARNHAIHKGSTSRMESIALVQHPPITEIVGRGKWIAVELLEGTEGDRGTEDSVNNIDNTQYTNIPSKTSSINQMKQSRSWDPEVTIITHETNV